MEESDYTFSSRRRGEGRGPDGGGLGEEGYTSLPFIFMEKIYRFFWVTFLVILWLTAIFFVLFDKSKDSEQQLQDKE